MAKTILGMIAILSLASALAAQDSSPPRVLMHRSQLPASFVAPRDAQPTLTVPAETEADVELLSGLHTRVTSVDDPIVARVLRPVLVEIGASCPAPALYLLDSGYESAPELQAWLDVARRFVPAVSS